MYVRYSYHKKKSILLLVIQYFSTYEAVNCLTESEAAFSASIGLSNIGRLIGFYFYFRVIEHTTHIFDLAWDKSHRDALTCHKPIKCMSEKCVTI